MDGDLSTLTHGAAFQVVRDGQVLADVVVHRIMGSAVRLNWPVGTFPAVAPQVGDAVNPAPPGP